MTAPSEFPVERGGETSLARYFRVNGAVTVRVGRHRVYACLTCRVTGCAHVRAAERFDRDTPNTPQQPQQTAA